MTELEKLQRRLVKLNEFWASLKQEEKWHQDGGGVSSQTTLATTVGSEFQRVESEIARLRMEEFLNMDENFEKEVLK